MSAVDPVRCNAFLHYLCVFSGSFTKEVLCVCSSVHSQLQPAQPCSILDFVTQRAFAAPQLPRMPGAHPKPCGGAQKRPLVQLHLDLGQVCVSSFAVACCPSDSSRNAQDA